MADQYDYLQSLGLERAYVPNIPGPFDLDEDDEYNRYKKTIRPDELIEKDDLFSELGISDEDLFADHFDLSCFERNESCWEQLPTRYLCDEFYHRTADGGTRFASAFAALERVKKSSPSTSTSTSTNTPPEKKKRKRYNGVATTCANLTSAPATISDSRPATKTHTHLLKVHVVANTSGGSQCGHSGSTAQIQVIREQDLKIIAKNTSSSYTLLNQESPLTTAMYGDRATFKTVRVEAAPLAPAPAPAPATPRLGDWRPMTPEDLDGNSCNKAMACYPPAQVTGQGLTIVPDAFTRTNVCPRCNTVVYSPNVFNFSDHTYDNKLYPSASCGCSCLETPCASPDSTQNAKSDGDPLTPEDYECMITNERNIAKRTCAKSPRAQNAAINKLKRRITRPQNEAANNYVDGEGNKACTGRAMTPHERREHNEKEKERRANMRQLFNELAKQIPIPTLDPSKPTPPRQEVLQKAKETIQFLVKQEPRLIMLCKIERERNKRLRKLLDEKERENLLI